MAMKIVILEDDQRRVETMRDRLADRFHQFEIVFFDSAIEIIDYLKEHVQETIAMALDHDLVLKADESGQTYDPGTGRDVANYLATIRPLFSIVIHSTNEFGAIGMESVLEEAGWQIRRISPFGDLEWIHNPWFPAIRDAIVGYGTAEASDKRNREI